MVRIAIAARRAEALTEADNTTTNVADTAVGATQEGARAATIVALSSSGRGGYRNNCNNRMIQQWE